MQIRQSRGRPDGRSYSCDFGYRYARRIALAHMTAAPMQRNPMGAQMTTAGLTFYRRIQRALTRLYSLLPWLVKKGRERKIPRCKSPRLKSQSRFPKDSSRGHHSAPCSHCGSTRHSDLSCWSQRICEHCRGKHPSDRCYNLCRGYGKPHEKGGCELESATNDLRKWNDPTIHAGVLPICWI